ncbi:MAG: type II toxin-antitoxin system death-on-curing family toxin [Planctomycetota bacterium]|jgi:death-on-curing protein|nr:type II toxin-antitoxin system death-on-curing family toxin [Planctomycetota bacterium]MDP6503315.1 type II toxin-antitoxin system death-on-curing family toxin [Planctomycetota bacterium]
MEIHFLSVEDVLVLHRESIVQEGGSHGVRDIGLLDSAVAMPQQQFGGQYLHEDIPAMAAAYLFHISSNHPFVDGNKRAGTLAAMVFLEENGVSVTTAVKEFEETVLSVARGDMGKDELTEWFREKVGT